MQGIIETFKELAVQYYFVPDIMFYVYIAVFVVAIIICNLSLFFSFGGRSGPAFTELLFSTGIACGGLPAGIYYINDKFLHFDKWIVVIILFFVFPLVNIKEPIKTLLNMNKIPLIINTDENSETEENPKVPENLEESSENEITENSKESLKVVSEIKADTNNIDKKETVTPKKRLSKRHKKK